MSKLKNKWCHFLNLSPNLNDSSYNKSLKPPCWLNWGLVLSLPLQCLVFFKELMKTWFCCIIVGDCWESLAVPTCELLCWFLERARRTGSEISNGAQWFLLLHSYPVCSQESHTLVSHPSQWRWYFDLFFQKALQNSQKSDCQVNVNDS